MHFQIGDRVKVMLPAGESTGAYTVKQFQGKVTVIKDIHVTRKGKSTLGTAYTLAGCKTDWGLPYWFCEEWLVPLDDEGVEE